MIQPQSCEHGRTAAITRLSCGHVGGADDPLPHPSMLEAGGSAGPGVIQAGELALFLTFYSTGRQATMPTWEIQ